MHEVKQTEQESFISCQFIMHKMRHKRTYRVQKDQFHGNEWHACWMLLNFLVSSSSMHKYLQIVGHEIYML